MRLDSVLFTNGGVESYIVEYSIDNFACVITFETTGTQVDFIALPVGTYQWRIKTVGSEIIFNGENIVSQQIVIAPQEFVSDADGNPDLFFANAKGEWQNG